MHINTIEFYDGDRDFGVIRKGKRHHASDFSFTFLAEVICADSRSSGFMIELTPRRCEGNDKRFVSK